jgi:hypothetical protein
MKLTWNSVSVRENSLSVPRIYACNIDHMASLLTSRDYFRIKMFEQVVSQGRHITPICTRALDRQRTWRSTQQVLPRPNFSWMSIHDSKYLEETPLEARFDVGSGKLMPRPAADFIDARNDNTPTGGATCSRPSKYRHFTNSF